MSKQQQRFIIHGVETFTQLGGPEDGQPFEMGFTLPAIGIDHLIERLRVIKEDGKTLTGIIAH